MYSKCLRFVTSLVAKGYLDNDFQQWHHEPSHIAWLMLPKTQNKIRYKVNSTRDKLIGPNFTNWYQNLRIVLRSEGKLAHLEQPLIPLPLLVAPQAVHDTYEVLFDAQNEVTCLMLGSMSPELQRALENYKAYDMIQELKTMFKEQAR
ncbi:hypothetical protein Tco_1325446 [Tanacetum coccineum]